MAKLAKCGYGRCDLCSETHPVRPMTAEVVEKLRYHTDDLEIDIDDIDEWYYLVCRDTCGGFISAIHESDRFASREEAEGLFGL